VPHEPSATSRAPRVFLAHLRHELRTPVNAIIGYGEMLLEDAAGRRQDDWVSGLQKIRAAGEQLLTIVNDILAPDKIEAGKFDDDIETVGAHLRHALLTSVNTIIGDSELLLEDAEAREQPDAVADLQKIHAAAQRFRSLLHDVVKYAQVQDDAPFQNAVTTAMLQNAVSSIRPLIADVAAPSSTPHATLLIVDDNDINRDVLSRRLERQGYTVAVATDGRQALEAVRTQPFDLILLDVIMPEMNGYQVLEQLKADATLRDIPVIVISALDELDSVVRCIERGAEDYLPKPFNPVLLRARIGACLEKKRLRDQEVEYLRNVSRITEAAAAVEAERFQPEDLDEVSARPDALGQLARVFQRMAREIKAREQRLKQEVQQLRIEIDEAKKARQVAEITETDYFQQLQEKVRRLRSQKTDQ
jgi:CheY-like chemotaxis protein